MKAIICPSHNEYCQVLHELLKQGFKFKAPARDYSYWEYYTEFLETEKEKLCLVISDKNKELSYTGLMTAISLEYTVIQAYKFLNNLYAKDDMESTIVNTDTLSQEVTVPSLDNAPQVIKGDIANDEVKVTPLDVCLKSDKKPVLAPVKKSGVFSTSDEIKSKNEKYYPILKDTLQKIPEREDVLLPK